VPTCLKYVSFALKEKPRVIVEVPEVPEFPEVRSQETDVPVQPSANLVPTERGGLGGPYTPSTVIQQLSSTYMSRTVAFTGPSVLLVESLCMPPLDPWEGTDSICRLEPILGLLENRELDTPEYLPTYYSAYVCTHNVDDHSPRHARIHTHT
jgi:hypothetical protein